MKYLDQPQILAALITGGLGLLVFAATQWVLHWREETKLLRTKLEELYRTLNKLGELQILRFKVYLENGSFEDLQKVQGGELTELLAMLRAFYFPELEAKVSAIMAVNNEILAKLSGTERAASAAELRVKIDLISEMIKDTCSYVCNNRRRLTFSRFMDFFGLRRK